MVPPFFLARPFRLEKLLLRGLQIGNAKELSLWKTGGNPKTFRTFGRCAVECSQSEKTNFVLPNLLIVVATAQEYEFLCKLF